MAEKRGGMTLSGRSYGRPCLLVVALCLFHLIVALMYILYSSETMPFLPYFSGASFNLTSLPTNLSLNDSDDVDLKTELPSNTRSEAGAGRQRTDLQLCPETPPHLGKSLSKMHKARPVSKTIRVLFQSLSLLGVSISTLTHTHTHSRICFHLRKFSAN